MLLTQLAAARFHPDVLLRLQVVLSMPLATGLGTLPRGSLGLLSQA